MTPAPTTEPKPSSHAPDQSVVDGAPGTIQFDGEAEHALIVCALEMPEVIDQLREGLFGDERALAMHRWLSTRRRDQVQAPGLDETLFDLRHEQFGLFLEVLKWLPTVHSPANWPWWEERARQQAATRHSLAVARAIQDGVKGGNLDLPALSLRLKQIETARTRPAMTPLATVIDDALVDMGNRYDNDRNIMGLPTGFGLLDSKTDGLTEKSLWVIAARPSVGKTTWGCNLMNEVGIRQAIPTCFYSLEMPSGNVMQKMWHIMGNVSQEGRRARNLNEGDFARLNQAAVATRAAPVNVIDNAATIQDISEDVRRLKSESGLRVIIVDYLQRVRVDGSRQDRWHDIGQVSNTLKNLAMEHSITVVALAQLNRDVEKEGREPTLSDLRGSAEIEADADVIGFLWKKGDALQFSIGKSRMGSIGMVPIDVNYDTGRITEHRERP